MNQKISNEIDGILEKLAELNDGIVSMGDQFPPVKRIPTGSLELDYITGGGIPVGRWTRLYGGSGCLASDTFINYAIRDSSGRVINDKGGIIERLYERFNNVVIGSGKGKNRNSQVNDAKFTVSSVNEDNELITNDIEDVFYSGEKEVFALETMDGLSIKATADHRFYDGENYIKLGDLECGDTVFVHANTYKDRGKIGTYVATPAIIKSITSVGIKPTYDITMRSPYNNFTANRFVVHNSGKSLTAYKAIGNAQKMGYVCAYVDAEKQYDPEWAEHHGVDTTALIVINSSVIEEIGETIDALLDTVDLFVIDSCSICVSRIKLEDGLNDRQYMGLNARQWQEQFVHLNSHFDHSRNTIIYLDHVRVQFGMGGISSLKPPGGKAMEFISSLTLEYKQGKWLWKRDGIFSDTRNTSQKTLSGGTEADGMEIKVKCQKSRVSKQFRTANLYLDLEEGSFDWVEEYFKAAKFFKIVEGAAWLKFEGSDKSLRPKEVKEMIREDKELRDKIRDRMMENA